MPSETGARDKVSTREAAERTWDKDPRSKDRDKDREQTTSAGTGRRRPSFSGETLDRLGAVSSGVGVGAGSTKARSSTPTSINRGWRL